MTKSTLSFFKPARRLTFVFSRLSMFYRQLSRKPILHTARSEVLSLR